MKDLFSGTIKVEMDELGDLYVYCYVGEDKYGCRINMENVRRKGGEHYLKQCMETCLTAIGKIISERHFGDSWHPEEHGIKLSKDIIEVIQ